MVHRSDARRAPVSSRAALNGFLPSGSRAPARVLVVESDLGLLASLAVALGPAIELDQAVTLTDVLDRIVGAPPHLVLLDAARPGLDAPAILRAVRAQRPDCRVLAIADQPHASRVVELAAAPLDGLLWKPVSIAKLLRHVAALLERPLLWPATVPRAQPSGPVSRCLDHIGRHFEDALTVKTIGAAVGVSVSHLGHRFRAETGQTIKSYVARIRVAAAQHLLRATTSASPWPTRLPPSSTAPGKWSAP